MSNTVFHPRSRACREVLAGKRARSKAAVPRCLVCTFPILNPDRRYCCSEACDTEWMGMKKAERSDAKARREAAKKKAGKPVRKRKR